MKSKISKYIIGILIALGFYLISMLIGSIINVLIAFTAGYRSWNAYMDSDNVVGAILILIISVINHVLISWVSTNVLLRYGKKNDCVSPWLFRSAACAVLVFTLIIIPVLFSKTPEWASILSHTLGIALFGRAKVKKYNLTLVGSGQSVSVTEPQDDNSFYCHRCGTKLDGDSLYCHNCGTKISQ